MSGTLSIVTGLGARTAARARGTAGRKPNYVSPATQNAVLFIDGAATPAGSTTECTPTGGTGTGCAIAWSANLTTPASHTFDVEIDTGSTGIPANTVLAEGQSTYALVTGSNSLPAMSLNGVVAGASFSVTGCSASGGGPTDATIDTCAGNVILSDAAGAAIVYSGSLDGPVEGQNPTSGNVYDNDGGNSSEVSFTSSTFAGTVSGTAQSPFSSYASGVLTIAGVNASGTYTYQVTCNPDATGSFGLVVGGGTSSSGDVTPDELSGISVSYPAPGVATLPTAPIFSCIDGAVSTAFGTLLVN